MAAQKQNQRSNNGPAHLVRCGALSVSIWKREHEGKAFYNVQPSRAYTEDDGATWSYSDSFGRDDALILAELLRSAWQWIRRAEMGEK
jgi:hypothetical protein